MYRSRRNHDGYNTEKDTTVIQIKAGAEGRSGRRQLLGGAEVVEVRDVKEEDVKGEAMPLGMIERNDRRRRLLEIRHPA